MSCTSLSLVLSSSSLFFIISSSSLLHLLFSSPSRRSLSLVHLVVTKIALVPPSTYLLGLGLFFVPQLFVLLFKTLLRTTTTPTTARSRQIPSV